MDISNKIPPENQAVDSVLDRNKKIAVAGLSVFALVLVVVWGASMKNSIYGPMDREDGQSLSQETCPNGNCALTEEERMKTRDTDGDGISDWEETYTYLTSPYLEDSDSDGLLDGSEVRVGQDPNCPLGQDCGGLSSENSSVVEESDASTSQDVVSDNQLFLTEEDVLNNQEALQKALSGQTDATSLRALLIESGADKDILDKMTDEQLMAAYSVAINNISTEE